MNYKLRLSNADIETIHAKYTKKEESLIEENLAIGKRYKDMENQKEIYEKQVETLNKKVWTMVEDFKKLNAVNNSLKDNLKELQESNEDLINNPIMGKESITSKSSTNQ